MDETGLSDVKQFIEQLNFDQNPSIPEFQGNDASSLIALSQALIGAHKQQNDLLKIAEFTRKSTQHVVNLQQHAESAGNLQDQFTSEIDKRSLNLRQVLSVTRSEVDESTATSSAMQDQTKEDIVNVVEQISNILKSINEELEAKSQASEKVLSSISDIGKAIKMLSFNATIEAGRAGDEGKGFAVVASEVRNLALTTLAHVNEATTELDFTSINQSLSTAISDCTGSLTQLDGKISTSMEQLGGFLNSVDMNLKEIEENNQVVFEILEGNQIVSERGHEKIRWASQEMYNLTGVLAMDKNDRLNGMESFLDDHCIQADPNFDRLENIQKNGVLRVAIEPSFVGLSFRLNEQDPLQGLDVEYAKAIAKGLGVKCEFVEHPWDVLTELLSSGRQIGEQEADIVLSALPPDASYKGIAYSETYTYLDFVLCRKVGDTEINGLSDLQDKVLGIINDPGAFNVLENAGLRWNTNADVAGGRIKLANLIAYSDQSRIHDCLADGIVNAFAVDLPIYHWACSDPTSPWFGKIEIIPGNIASDPYYYCVAVSAHSSSYKLLQAINKCIITFKNSPDRKALEEKWQGSPVDHTLSYRDEEGDLLGEDGLKIIYDDHAKRHSVKQRKLK